MIPERLHSGNVNLVESRRYDDVPVCFKFRAEWHAYSVKTETDLNSVIDKYFKNVTRAGDWVTCEGVVFYMFYILGMVRPIFWSAQVLQKKKKEELVLVAKNTKKRLIKGSRNTGPRGGSRQKNSRKTSKKSKQ